MTTDHSGRFLGLTLVVTGAGSGIGRATALRIAQEGGRVVATDLDAGSLDRLVSETGGSTVRTVAGDITDGAVIDAVLAAADGPVAGLANVAGVMDGFLPPSEVDDATWDRVMAVNLTAPMRLARAVLPGMIAAGGGAVVNVASEAALRGSAAGAAYTASKHALVGYTKNVAFLHGPQGIRANVVAPGPVITNIEARMKSDFAAARVGPVMKATLPAPVLPDRLAAAITWLLSEDSANVNGAVLPSDGGWSAV
ncbi:SDR family oxidoreductase [Streptomyces sp. NBC_01102]|uniref:SDR family NAD(P)-dependent oxidoreductase n=1 Tax=Streptomyces sp. NBC_01102 TaxID=2903749 RepID=UPI00386EDBAF|nr:SDR family oxidoreductase [Streptomyces sp. NBC_01102]